MDYFKDIGGVKYTSAPELREGLNHSGFLADQSQIQPTFEEVWNGLTTNIDEIARRTGAAVMFSPTRSAIIVVCITSFSLSEFTAAVKLLL